MRETDVSRFSRRAFLSSSGALVVALAAPGDWADAAVAPDGLPARPPISPGTLASYITVERDGTVVAYFGKIDGGQGVETAIAQFVADEIDVPFERVRVVMGDTALTVDMGGASAGIGMQHGGMIMRQTAAEARRVLIDMASRRLDVPATGLTVTDGVVHSVSDPGKRISYAALIGGRHLDAPVAFDGAGSDMSIKVQAPLKKPSELKVVGKPMPRRDIPGKVFGTLKQIADVRLPGMLHGRTIRPSVAGAVPVAVDENSIRDIPGARVVWIKDFLAVVAPKEWNAVRAARALKVTWSESKPNFPAGHDALYAHMRKATPIATSPERPGPGGTMEDGLKDAVRIIQAEYEYPMQSHASMAPGCGVADVRADGATVWTSSQKPYDTATGVAELLQMPLEKVRAIWIFGPGSYGRNDQGDAVADAALLSKHLGRPVRVQYMRHEGLAWDPKAPPMITSMRAGLDASGTIVAYEHIGRGFSFLDCNTREHSASDLLAGVLTGAPVKSAAYLRMPDTGYGIARRRVRWEVVAPLMDRASPLRTTHLRDPAGVPHLFGTESFMDEIAVATNSDPIALRLRYLKKEREQAAIRAVAEHYGWDTRPSPRRDQPNGNIAVGRGFAYRQKGETYGATIAEVKVHRDTGIIEIERLVCAQDCGLIVNPETVRHVADRAMVWQIGRTLCEELQFDADMVTSVDWLSYPVGKMASMPKSIEVILIDRPDMPVSGAGEYACGAIPAVIANAVFDATGVRLRRVPFTPERVKAALERGPEPARG